MDGGARRTHGGGSGRAADSAMRTRRCHCIQLSMSGLVFTRGMENPQGLEEGTARVGVGVPTSVPSSFETCYIMPNMAEGCIL